MSLNFYLIELRLILSYFNRFVFLCEYISASFDLIKSLRGGSLWYEDRQKNNSFRFRESLRCLLTSSSFDL